MILPVFKAGDPSLRGVDGGFDSHTLPPYSFVNQKLAGSGGGQKGGNNTHFVRRLAILGAFLAM